MKFCQEIRNPNIEKWHKNSEELENSYTLLIWIYKSTVRNIVKKRGETFTHNPIKKQCAQKIPIFYSGRIGGPRMVVPIPKIGYNKQYDKQ